MILKLILFASWALLNATQATEHPPATEAALRTAGENRKELERALSEIPEVQREGMRFLIDHMPLADLTQLTADFLLNHVSKSYQVRMAAPWSNVVPQELFFNDVLAYASLNEVRDQSRTKLSEIATPLVRDCKTPGEAALVLNQKLFEIVRVKYSTKRKKPDQSALESIESGLASCTGLSILLVEACRSVGIPARVVGTPLWTTMPGNHTWVEIWDGNWHFLGAAEPDPNGLDHGWFKASAAAADDDKMKHRIYASSFKRTGTFFPLVWDPAVQWVSAINVTARYTQMSLPADGRVKLQIRVLDKPDGVRIATEVGVVDASDLSQVFSGMSVSDTADLNHLLTFQLQPARSYQVTLKSASGTVKRDVTLTTEAIQTITLTLAN